jgi:mRNA-degrading endonuclease toxin of MazEF toxin-antitoxin module
VAFAGEAFWLELKGDGQEQRGRRPMIVVQDDAGALLSTRLCVPTSTNAGPSSWRVPVELDGRETLAMVDQLRVVSLHRLASPAGRISVGELMEIRNAAWSLLGFLG